MVASLGRFDHGADVYDAAGKPRQLIDFSASLNPLGMPEAVVDALRSGVGHFDAYPDPASRALRAALAQAHGVPVDYLVCTAGASDLIARLCQVLRPDAALVTAPCFSGYEQALEQVGARIVRIPWPSPEGQPPFLQGGAPLCFLCNPNNPTGLVLDRALLAQLLDEARSMGMVVALDECFLDFTDEPSAVELCEEYPNLVVIRAFTKLYAMAGLRLGYGVCSDVGFVRRLHEAGQPWAVSTPAQVAGLAALAVPQWAERTRAYVDREREVLADGLRRLGMEVVPGKANYLLFKSAVPLYEPLLERGFLIRRCGNFVGLDDSWYRVAVRTAGENAALLAALQDVMGDRREVQP